MDKVMQIEAHLERIESIRYENQNGGAYAYVQFLAYTRELLALLRPLEKMEKQADALEGINWLFNECLAARFTHRQKVIFETKLSDAVQIFGTIRTYLREEQAWQNESVLSKQAA